MKTAVIVHGQGMGHGDESLGRRILQTAFNKAAALDGLEAIVFYNTGVRLLAEGSECLPALAALHDRGVDLIACGTCVDFFALRDPIRVGHVGSMDDILSALNKAEKVITL